MPPGYSDTGAHPDNIPIFIDLREKPPKPVIHWGVICFYGFIPMDTDWEVESPYDRTPALYYYDWSEVKMQGHYGTIPVYILNLINNKKYIMEYPLENDWDQPGYAGYIYGSESKFDINIRQEDW